MINNSEEIKIENFISLPYASRRIICFLTDYEYVEKFPKDLPYVMSKIDTHSSASLRQLDPSIINTALHGSFSFNGASIATAAMIASASALAYSKYKSVRSNKIDCKILPLSMSSVLSMPPGHPRLEVLYAGHPLKPVKYIPISSFHRALLEDKLCELINLIMCLGAKSIVVEHSEGCGINDYIAGTATLLKNGSFKVESNDKEATSSAATFKTKLPGNDTPRLHDNPIWYHHEQTWQQLVEARTIHNVRNYSLKLTYKDDYGVDMKLKMKAESAGLELGGKFEHHIKTEWKISVDFEK